MKYDKSATLFSDEGEILQVLYAREASLRGSNLIVTPWLDDLLLFSISTQNKEYSALLDRRSIDNIAKVHDGVWIAFTGLAGDGRSLVKQARNFAVEYYSKLSCFPSARSVANHLGQVQHSVTLGGGISKTSTGIAKI